MCELNMKRHDAASCSDAALREAVRREIATSGLASAIGKSVITYE